MPRPKKMNFVVGGARPKTRSFPPYPPPLHGQTTGGDVEKIAKNMCSALWSVFWQLEVEKQVEAFLCRPNLPMWIDANFPSDSHDVIKSDNVFVCTELKIERPNSFPENVDPYFTLDQWFETEPNSLAQLEQNRWTTYVFQMGNPECHKTWEFSSSGQASVIGRIIKGMFPLLH